MKLIVLLVIAFLLLGGAGFGGWLLYNKYTAEHAEGQPKKEEPPPPPPPTVFVRLPPVVVPLIGKDRVEQFITVVVTLEVELTKQPKTQESLPRLSDTFLTTLYGAVDDKSVLTGGVINIPAVKQKFTTAAAGVLGPDGVRNILIQVVTQRNL